MKSQPGEKSSQLHAIRRQLLLAEKGAVNKALRQRILSEHLMQAYIKDLNEQLIRLEDNQHKVPRKSII